jgi:hypothetical protein
MGGNAEQVCGGPAAAHPNAGAVCHVGQLRRVYGAPVGEGQHSGLAGSPHPSLLVLTDLHLLQVCRISICSCQNALIIF